MLPPVLVVLQPLLVPCSYLPPTPLTVRHPLLIPYGYLTFALQFLIPYSSSSLTVPYPLHFFPLQLFSLTVTFRALFRNPDVRSETSLELEL